MSLKYRGDCTDQFRIGQAIGPGQDRMYRQVTAVTYDPATDRTLVDVERVDVAPEGRRLRYFGGTDAPPEHDTITREEPTA